MTSSERRAWEARLMRAAAAGQGQYLWTGTEPERIRISASRMVELKPRIAALLADGWTMTRMDKPVAEGCDQDVVVWFERRRCDTT